MWFTSSCPKWVPRYEAGGTIAVVESVKAASDIYAPAKGTVVEANKALESNPALINTDPYGDGWIFVLKIDDPAGARFAEGRGGLQGCDRLIRRRPDFSAPFPFAAGRLATPRRPAKLAIDRVYGFFSRPSGRNRTPPPDRPG